MSTRFPYVSDSIERAARRPKREFRSNCARMLKEFVDEGVRRSVSVLTYLSELRRDFFWLASE